MENRQKSQSVIAKLMGFDETPRQHQPVSRQYNALSKNYLQKSDSIGKRSRIDSQNYKVRSKKRANTRTNDPTKNISSRDFEHKSTRLDPIVSNSVNNGENVKLHIGTRLNSANVKYVSGPSFLLDSQTIFAWEIKKQLLERFKMTKKIQEHESDFGRFIGIRKKDRKYESVTNIPIFKHLNSPSNLYKKYANTTKTTKTEVKQTCGNRVSNSLIPFTVNSEADSGTEGGCSISSNYVQFGEEHHDCKVEMHQNSPNSVLEAPFRDSSSSEYCESAETDLHDLWMQLQLLKSESEEHDIMITSSDDEKSCTDQNIISLIPFGTKESRDFSYLTDVLDESGFQDNDIEIHFEKWHSSDIMAGPTVFETLEKKYGKQEFWHKAERKLLFDRINDGIAVILKPQADIRGCCKLLRKKIVNMLRRDVIEEELLTFLVGQEKGVNDGVSEKAVGRGVWFDPVDEVDSLVREIEVFLFDLLVTELLF